MVVRVGSTREEKAALWADGFMPVMSTDTAEEARALVILACQTNSDGEYVARELIADQTIENLESFGERLERIYLEHIRK